MKRPLVDIGAGCELKEFPGIFLFHENFRPAGAMRHKAEPLHGIVIGRYIIKRGMMDGGSRCDLSNGGTGLLISKIHALRRIKCSFSQTALLTLEILPYLSL